MAYKFNIRNTSNTEWENLLNDTNIEVVGASGSFIGSSLDAVLLELSGKSVANLGNAGTSLDVDCSIYGIQTFTCDQSTLALSASNFTVGKEIVLIVTNGGGCAITWPSGTQWPGGTEPTWTTTGTDRVRLQKIAAGTILGVVDGLNFS